LEEHYNSIIWTPGKISFFVGNPVTVTSGTLAFQG